MINLCGFTMNEANVRRTLKDGMVGYGVGFERYRRLTGYLGKLENINSAKQAEIRDRKKHIGYKNND